MACILEWDAGEGQLERVDFDAAVTVSFESSAEATEHATESGAAISDHVRPNGDVVTIEGLVTNAPIVMPSYQTNGASGSTRGMTLRVGGREVTVNVLQFSTALDRVRAVDGVLHALQEAGELLTLYTSLRVVDRLVIQRYKVDRSAEVGDALALTIEFKRLRLASTQRVDAPRRQRRRVQRGPQPAAPEDTSLWQGAVDRITGRGR